MKALFTVFVQPALSTSRTVRPQRFSRNLSAAPTQRIAHQTRPFSASHHLCAAPARGPEVRKQRWNEEIKARMIQLVDPKTDKLMEPLTRYDVLKNLDQKTHRLVQLSPWDPEQEGYVPMPVCKIISKKEAYESEKKKKAAVKENKAAAAKERTVKTLELNWAIDGNDLAHRMEKVKTFLEEGRRVEVVLATKKRGRKATAAECEEVLGKLREVAGSVNGVKESPMEGKMGGFATLTFQGKVGAVAKE